MSPSAMIISTGATVYSPYPPCMQRFYVLRTNVLGGFAGSFYEQILSGTTDMSAYRNFEPRWDGIVGPMVSTKLGAAAAYFALKRC